MARFATNLAFLIIVGLIHVNAQSGRTNWATSCATRCVSFFDELEATSVSQTAVCSGLRSDGLPCLNCIRSVNTTAVELVSDACPSVVNTLEASTGPDWVANCANQCTNFFAATEDASRMSPEDVDVDPICTGLFEDGRLCTSCIAINATGLADVTDLCPSVVSQLGGTTTTGGTSTTTPVASTTRRGISTTARVSSARSINPSPSMAAMSDGIDWVTTCASRCPAFFATTLTDGSTTAQICSALTVDGSPCPLCIQSTNSTGFSEVRDVCPSQVRALVSTASSSSSAVASVVASNTMAETAKAAGDRKSAYALLVVSLLSLFLIVGICV